MKGTALRGLKRIKKIDMEKFTVEFAILSIISVDKIIRLIKESGGLVKLDPKKPNTITLETGKIGLKEKSEFIREKLETLITSF